MRWFAAALGTIVTTCMLACSGQNPPEPPSVGDSDGSVVRLSGNERLGWDQSASSQDELGGFQYRLYVDNAYLADLLEVICGDLRANQTAECSGRIPSLTMGQHALSLTSVDANRVESDRSSSIQVLVVRTVSSLAGGSGALDASGQSRTESLQLQSVIDGLREPTDLAVAADRRVLVAERSGQVRIIADGVLQARPAITLDDVRADDAAGLLGIAIDPGFAENHHVYLLYTTIDGIRVSRFRESGGTLGERAIVLDGVTSTPHASAAVRFGPDGKLYVTVDDGGDPGRAGDLGTYDGKVLRLNTDGSVPSDQAGLTPVFVTDVAAPRSLDWTIEGKLWIAEGASEGSGMLDLVMDEQRAGRRGRVAARYRLPDGQVPSSVLVYRGGLIKQWVGDLLVALPEAGQLVRIHFDPADTSRVLSTEVVLDATAGRIRALGVTAEGIVYVANDAQLLALAPSAPAANP